MEVKSFHTAYFVGLRSIVASMVELCVSDVHKAVKIVMIILLYCGAFQAGHAQLFPGLEGDQLTDALRDAYTPGQLLNDTQVRDTLYAKVFAESDSVRCIYSGFAKFLPVGVDPSQWLFGTGFEIESMNLEHGWPQAKGAGKGTDGNVNMFHLFPSRTAINSDRANFPFADIPDHLTQKWYYRDKEMAVMPGNSIHAYSEYINGSFEPRESVKGDIARAMFYFWTIYREDALAADPFFFGSQLADLCAWHEQDPVDAAELMRNDIIAHYQDGKGNPFITDCSLIRRAYCSALSECDPVSSGVPGHEEFVMQFLPGSQQLSIVGSRDQIWQLQIIDQLGRTLSVESLPTNQVSFPLTLPAGVYFAFATDRGYQLTLRFMIP